MDKSIFEDLINGVNSGNDSDDEENDVELEATEDSSEDNDSPADRVVRFLTQVRDESLFDDDEEGDDDDDDISAEDYHNRSVTISRLKGNKKATEICIAGLEHYPLNVTLLADVINYSYNSGDADTASKYYTILKNTVPFRCWTWRAFTFAINYLLGENPVENEKECRALIRNYKKYIPSEERAFVAESELEAALGNAKRSMTVLEDTIASRENAPQCALRLADMQVAYGLFEQAISTCNYGIAASAEPQPTINVPYLYLVRALAKDHILHKNAFDKKEVDYAEVKALSAEYMMLLGKFTELKSYSRNIMMRVKMLEILESK